MLNRVAALVFAVACITAPAFGVTRSWTGATSASWSDGSNWSPAGVPTPADQLVFPAGVTRLVMTNDLPAGTSVGSVAMLAEYTLNGNPLTLTGPWTFDFASWNFVCNVGLTLAAPVRLVGVYNGPIDVNGQTLTLDWNSVWMNGALSGTGVIDVPGLGITMTSSGTFSGTIQGMIDVSGSLPNATFTGGLSGTGTVGAVTISAGYSLLGASLYLGERNRGSADPHSIGTLHTKSISIQEPFYVDLVPGGTSDLLQVTGSVTLAGRPLHVSVQSGSPAPGQSFTIIDNDSTDAVSGTFENLPEGGQLTVAGRVVQISYSGGTGNDVVLTPITFTKTWTGAVDALWSTPGNWSPVGAPIPGEALVFPAGVARTVMTNDLPAGTSVGAVSLLMPYTLNGNALTLDGEWTFTLSSSPFICNVGLHLGRPLHLRGSFNGPIDVNGHTLMLDANPTSLAGGLNGTGTVAVFPAREVRVGSGNFSGTITGVIDLGGSMPNATFSGGLTGNGTLGDVTISAGYSFLGANLSPGLRTSGGGVHTIGTLQTKSIAIQEPFYVDLVPGGTSDQLLVTGTVTLNGQALNLSVNGSPGAGQSFTLISNDGTDAVSGTFAGLPEGAQIPLGGAVVQISYLGGDGNDVVLTPVTFTKTWTGANDALWSNPGNWSPVGVPAPGEPLVFPSGAVRTVMTNDLPAGTSTGPVEFLAPYTLNGNALTLGGEWFFSPSAASFICNVALELGVPTLLLGEYNGPIDVHGQTLTVSSFYTKLNGALNGTGIVDAPGIGISLPAGGTFSGTIKGMVEVNGSMPDATIVGGLSGTGTVGAVTIDAGFALLGASLYPGPRTSTGTLHTKSISVGETLYADLAAGGTSDQLHVTGTVTLGGKPLAVTVRSGSPAAGDAFVLIHNDGTDPVDGTFSGLSEGSVLAQAPWKYRVTYAGGDGNDVVLTAIEDTEIVQEQNAPSTQFGETATFSARVSARVGMPNGHVTFTDNGAAVQTVPLVNGVASFAYATLDPGVHTVAAVYDGTAVFAPSIASVTHEVLRGNTNTLVTPPANAVVYGDPVQLSITVQAVAPAFGTPTGAVSVETGKSTVASVTLHEGAGSAPAIWLDAGTYQLVASYPGDPRFEASDSTSSSVTVLKAPTTTDAALSQDASGLTLTIHVAADDRPALPVVGVVQVMDGSTVIAQQTLAAGPVEIALGTLSPGEHRLTVTYLGTSNFEPSSTTIVHARRGKRRAVR